MGQSSPTPSRLRVRKSEGRMRGQWARKLMVEPPTPFQFTGVMQLSCELIG